MTILDPLFWFAVVALCLAVGALIAKASRFYAAQLGNVDGRFETLDGLRGFLALGVLGAHAVNMYTWRSGGGWGSAGGFYEQAGYGGVALFFAITGYLFWLRVLKSHPALDAVALYRSRLRRIVPMYAFSVLCVLAVAASVTGLAPNESLPTLAKELRGWASFGFLPSGPINGFADAHYINAVYWTLAYEWAFYLALPFLALFARGASSVVLLAAVLFFGTQAPVVYNFLAGALTAMLVHAGTLRGRRLDSPWLAPVALGALAAFFVFPGLPALLRTGLLFAFFVLVVHGQSLFGLLRSRPAKVLGLASYSIYLLHCIVLFVIVRAVDAAVPVAQLPAVQYWLVIAGAACLTVLLSALTYQHVEYPFIRPSRAQPGAQPAAGTSPLAPWKIPSPRV